MNIFEKIAIGLAIILAFIAVTDWFTNNTPRH